MEAAILVLVLVALASAPLLGSRRGRDRPRPPGRPRPAPPRTRRSRPAPPPAEPDAVLRGRCHVIDGDTIVIGTRHVRLFGIDAPELDQPYGQKAKWALIHMCKGRVVTAIPEGEQSYGRLVALCHLDDGTDLSGAMVVEGIALDWAKFSGGRYRPLEPEGVRRRLWRVEAKHRGRLVPPGQAGPGAGPSARRPNLQRPCNHRRCPRL